MKHLMAMLAALILAGGCSGPTPEPAATPKAEPTATPAPADLPWWAMTAADYEAINVTINQWATDSLGYDLEFHSNAELRADACLVWQNIGYDFNRLEDHGASLVAQGLLTYADWEEADVLLGAMHGAIVMKYTDSFMEARRAGHTSVTPAEAIIPAYCALGPALSLGGT